MKTMNDKKCQKEKKSINLTIFLMRSMGMWYVTNKKEKIFSSLMLSIVFLCMIVSIFVQSTELNHAKGNIKELTYITPCSSVVFTEFIKLLVFTFNRKKVMNLNKFMDEEFWNAKSSREDINIFNGYDRICFKAIIIYILALECTAWHYIIAPYFESTELNVTERVFPFPIYVNFPITETPYYEVALLLEIFGTLATGLCTITFASYLFVTNMFTAAQFKILNTHIQYLCEFNEDNIKNVTFQMTSHENLKNCIRKHQALINYTNEIENLLCYAMLVQIFGSILQICFSGFQIILSNTNKVSTGRVVLSIEYVLASFLQLYFYCYSSHEVFIESGNISESIYFSKWFKVTHLKIKKDFSQLLMIVVYRARRPCILTVGKFTPLNLNTFSSVLSTSLSYFTVLRQTVE